MDIFEAMDTRHAVRKYLDKPIEGEVKDNLIRFIDDCNRRSGLSIQLVLDEPQAFSGKMAHYGKFEGV